MKINQEVIKSSPLTISYDDNDLNGEFIANKYEFKLGYGLNLIEFDLKVPQTKESLELEQQEQQIEVEEEDENGIRLRPRGAENDEIVYINENIKIWATIAH